MITIDNLRHFVAVVQNKGVLKAAEKISISASSISRSVQIIEKNMEFTLFDRVGRHIHLNQNGLEYYQQSKNLLENYDRLTIGKATRKGVLTGNYSFGASHFLAAHFLSDLITKLSKLYPEATFEVFSFDSQILMKKIHSGEIDIGVSFSPKLSENLDSYPLSSGQLYLCGGKKHVLANKPFLEVKNKISSLPAIIHRPSESIERCDNHPMFTKYAINPRIQMYWDSDYFALSVLAKNQHWSMLPECVINADPRIVCFNHPKDWDARYDVLLVWNKKKTISELKAAVVGLTNQ